MTDLCLLCGHPPDAHTLYGCAYTDERDALCGCSNTSVFGETEYGVYRNPLAYSEESA
jgi:hypothetical protein